MERIFGDTVPLRVMKLGRTKSEGICMVKCTTPPHWINFPRRNQCHMLIGSIGHTVPYRNLCSSSSASIQEFFCWHYDNTKIRVPVLFNTLIYVSGTFSVQEFKFRTKSRQLFLFLASCRWIDVLGILSILKFAFLASGQNRSSCFRYLDTKKNSCYWNVVSAGIQVLGLSKQKFVVLASC